MRWSAAAAILILAAYHAMRVAASKCSGGGCDVYIPLSLALPLAAIVMVAVTGFAGVLILLCPVCVLAYSFFVRRPAR